MELSPHINDQPIGMIASSWGGTPVEAWSDSAALNSCGTNFNYGCFIRKLKKNLNIRIKETFYMQFRQFECLQKANVF